MSIICKTIKSYGRVHGVFFRESAYRRAKALNLKGYAKNLEDNCVEMVVCGGEDGVDEFLIWARRGPLLAKVDKIEIKDREDAIGIFKNFSIEN